MKWQEIREKTSKELVQNLIEDREKLRKLRFNLALGKVKNIREVRKIRKEIARILTFLNLNKKNK